ncbi:hypothetical protein [Chitinophaga niabensis]|uniref:Uncharacterized protein n=1 Tax=Chitinophaga niabensis TaxID=536979 RepID=A0A1N6KCJ2_9BACT|nr:hypothetical protein [Chitinophaga niabensis]SIO54285.1 hypothetical protein SAMN04488055_5573 [Chitinophaga niabensis]
MKKNLHINPELQLLTTTQMNEIRGGDVIDVNEVQDDIELPKLPNLPSSQPNFIPVYVNQ